eukprot:5444644-Amphidinium_carterae.1
MLGHVIRLSADQWLKGFPEHQVLPFKGWKNLLLRFQNARSWDKLPSHIKDLKALYDLNPAAHQEDQGLPRH